MAVVVTVGYRHCCRTDTVAEVMVLLRSKVRYTNELTRPLVLLVMVMVPSMDEERS